MMTLDTILNRYPDISTLLWLGSIFRGDRLLDLQAHPSMFPADASDVLLWLARQGYIRHAKFMPSHSACAFLGLDAAYHKSKDSPPNAGNAYAFDWIVEVVPAWPVTKEAWAMTINEIDKAVADLDYPEFMAYINNLEFDYSICDDCGGTGYIPAGCCQESDCGCNSLPIDFNECNDCRQEA